MTPIAILAAFSLMACTSAIAGPRARFGGTSIILTDRGQKWTLPGMTDPHAFYKTLHAVAHRGSDWYIVYGSSEMSRGWPPGDGHCGAGIESFVRWIHVRDGKIVDRQEALLESCLQDRYAWAIAWQRGKLTCRTTGIRRTGSDPVTFQSTDLVWTFDPSQPDKGLPLAEHPQP